MCVVNKIIKTANHVSYSGVWHILTRWKHNTLVAFPTLELNKIMPPITFIWVSVSIINLFFSTLNQ